jgi:hypothetical protein
MSAELIMQLIFDCAESLENGFSTKERTVKDLFNIINMIEERGIK